MGVRSIIGMKNADSRPRWGLVLTVCMLPLKGRQGRRSHVAAHTDLGGSKELTGSLSSINLSLRDLLRDSKIFLSISVNLAIF